MPVPTPGVRRIELSHPITGTTAPYPGLPGPRVTPHRTHEDSAGLYGDGATFEITMLELVGNTGTYLDSPAHRYPGRRDIGGIALDRVLGLRAVVIPAETDGPRPVRFPVTGEMAGAAVLVHTGWDRRWGTDAYYAPAPYLATATAEQLVEVGAALVGIDSWNVDDTRTTTRPVHTALLDAEILIVEHLTGLQELPARGATFNAVPLAVHGAVSMPVRAWAELP